MGENTKGERSERLKKSKRVTFRLTVNELESLKTNLAKAGFKTLGAYIREHLKDTQPKAKLSISLTSVQIALELQKIANMINQEKNKTLLIEELYKLNNKLLGIRP